jgi:hypothetical protein
VTTGGTPTQAGWATTPAAAVWRAIGSPAGIGAPHRLHRTGVSPTTTRHSAAGILPSPLCTHRTTAPPRSGRRRETTTGLGTA